MQLYQFDWELVRSTGCLCSFAYKFDAVEVEGTPVTLPTETPYPADNSYTIVSSINSLGLSTLEAHAYKTTFPENSEDPIIYSIILNVDATGDVFLRVRNSDDTRNIYIKGEVVPSIPSGYSAACVPLFTTTTTTTTSSTTTTTSSTTTTTSSTTTTTTAPPL